MFCFHNSSQWFLPAIDFYVTSFVNKCLFYVVKMVKVKKNVFKGRQLHRFLRSKHNGSYGHRFQSFALSTVLVYVCIFLATH